MIESRLRVRLSEEHPFHSLATSATSCSTVSAAQSERRLPLPTGRLVLLIDDSPTIRHIVERTLRKAGYEVRSFRDGIETMKWFAEPEARTPNLMLVSLSLPKLDGYEVIQKFKARPRFAHTPCILLSQRESAADKLKGIISGVDASMIKPFTIQQLLATVQKVISDEN